MEKQRPEARTYTEDEVAEVFKKASNYQATPTPTSLTRDELRSIAREVGLSDEALERALAELDGTDKKSVGERLLGAPTKLVFEKALPFELTPEKFERLVAVIREELDDTGIVSLVGRSLTFLSTHHGSPRRGLQYEVTIVVTPGTTTLRVLSRHSNVAFQSFFPITYLGGVLTFLASIAVTSGHVGSVNGIAELVALPVLFGVSRLRFGSMVRKRGDQLQKLLSRLLEVAKEER